MLLAVDVGNTQTVIGVFEETETDLANRKPGELPGLLHHWRISTVRDRTADEFAVVLDQLLQLVGLTIPGRGAERQPDDSEVRGVVVSSSVPSLTSAMREMSTTWFRVPFVVIGPGIRTGMPILYDNPREVGADRIANGVGAADLFGGPAIVVDFGTSTNFDVVSSSGEYMGGAIAVGLEVSMDALFEHAAALPHIELVAPSVAIGRSTVTSMQIGAIFGHAGLVDGICRRIVNEIGEATVIGTGGLVEVVAPYTEYVREIEPWLTLHGLRLLYGRNIEDERSR
ncbi:MAG: type III pantothenate kinase [Acidimicrobiales bacterium]